MSQEAYELAALTMRYVFTALMLLIVWRACRGALIDSRRAAKLRQLSPMTGVCGELVALEADERLRRGMRFPVIREGAIGSARRSDVRIRHSSVRRRHAFFQLADDGLHVRSHAGARLRDGGGRLVRELVDAHEQIDLSYPVHFGSAFNPEGVRMLREAFPEVPADALELTVGCIVGTHTGPGVFAISFISGK